MYLNSLHNPFVYDDHHTVVQNPSIERLTDVRAVVLGAVTRPIVNFSYAVDRASWGAAPFGFHVTNVLLHMLNVVLLFQLAWRMPKDRPADSGVGPAAHSGLVAFVAAALLAVHPMMTEAVGYISGRSEVLCATFFMLAMMTGRRWLAGHGRWGALTVGLWIAALATKESAAMFPFVFLAYDWLATAGDAIGRRRRLLTVHLPLIATAIVAGIIRLIILARIEYPGQVSLHWSYLLLGLDVVRRYVWMLLNPSRQTVFHEVTAVGLFDARTWLAVVVVGGMLALSWRLRRSHRLASVGILWFLLSLVPSAVLTALDQGEPMAEHRIYLASCGLFLAVSAGVGHLAAWGGNPAEVGRRANGYVRAGLALVVLAFAVQTILRNAVWADPVALWQESVDLAPFHYRPRLLLGEALQDAGRRNQALEQYETAIRLRPTDPMGYLKVGQCLAEIGQWPEAREHFLKAIAIDPLNGSARASLAVLDDVESRFGIERNRR